MCVRWRRTWNSPADSLNRKQKTYIHSRNFFDENVKILRFGFNIGEKKE